MDIKNLKIDINATLGTKYWLTNIYPVNVYKNNKRTDEICGYRYMIVLPDKGLDKIGVKIDGERRMDVPENFVPVEFDGLELYMYWMDGKPQVGARAKDIRPAVEILVD